MLERHDDVVDACGLRGALYLFSGDVLVEERDVFRDRGVQKPRVLRHERDMLVPRGERVVVGRSAVYEDSAVGRFA